MNIRENPFIGSRDTGEKAHCSPRTEPIITDRSQPNLH